jgi:hypothetical protein
MSAESSPDREPAWDLQVEDFAIEVAERSLRLRQQADAAGAAGVSELTTLLAAMGHIAAKLEARCRARGDGALDDAGAIPAAVTAPAGAARAGTDPEQVAREMAAGGAGRTEVEDYLRRHFERSDARRIARRVLRLGPEPSPGRRRDR